MTTLPDTIAATLAEHGVRRVTCGDEWIWECTAPDCAWIDTRIHEGLDAHRAHVATILAEQEAQRLKAELVWWGRGA